MKKIFILFSVIVFLIILAIVPYDTDNAGRAVNLLGDNSSSTSCGELDGGIGLKTVPFGVTATTCDAKYYFLFGRYLLKTSIIDTEFAESYSNFSEDCKKIWEAQCLDIDLMGNTGSNYDESTGVLCIEPDCETVLKNYGWDNFSETAGDFGLWDISFDYPKGYSVLAGSTDSFTSYDIVSDEQDQVKIRIIVATDDKASLLNSLSSQKTSDDGVTIMYTKIGDNNVYATNPDKLYHIAGFSSLDSDPYDIYIIDESPTDNTKLIEHVYETLQVVAK